jgi:Lon protease-like protein
MILSDVVLFPGMMLPLRIFEPRYRRMLGDVLAADRQFVIATRQPDAIEESPYGVACLGLVRASVENSDGTSNLFLLGITRVRVLGQSPKQPYPVLRLAALPDTDADSLRAEALALKLKEFVRDKLTSQDPARLRAHLDALESPSRLADTLAHALVRPPRQKLELLNTPCVPERLERLAAFLMENP